VITGNPPYSGHSKNKGPWITAKIGDGGERTLYFKNGKADSSDCMATIRTEKTGDLNRVFIGSKERFEIPDAVIFGG
jgi:hypothetical protein